MPGPFTVSEMRMDAASWAELNCDHDLVIIRANWDGFTDDVVAAVWADDDHDELATAQVLAAAPELHKAAKTFLESTFAAPYRLISPFKELAAAVAKAEGRS